MNPVARLAGAALVIVLGVGVALLTFRPGPDVGSPVAPTPTTEATQPATGSAVVPPVADGLFAAEPIPVAGILDRLESNPDLNAEARTAVINTVLMLEEDATHLHVRLEVTGDRLVLRYGTDEENLWSEDPWSLYILDPTTIALGRNQGNHVIQAWRITKTPGGFTMSAVSPATDPVEAFVRSVLFETAEFSPVR
jgi:hypothetical protein